MPFTNYGKWVLAEALYSRGLSFLGAAELLRKNSGHEAVVLHLLCQGLEIVLKALLLFKDFDSYPPKVQRELGHDVVEAYRTSCEVFGLKRRLDGPTFRELELLSKLYAKHFLRYGEQGLRDIVLDPTKIPSERTWRLAGAVIRLAQRHLKSRREEYQKPP